MPKRAESMAKIDIELANTIHWDQNEPDKVYLDSVRICFDPLPFVTRPVYIRFSPRLALDLSAGDMDRIAIGYLRLRGAKLPPDVIRLTKAKPPPKCDFVVPSWVLPKPSDANDAAPHAQRITQKRCARCRKRQEYSGDWYGDLCPECADATEGQWLCRRCKRRGNFEEMGGDGATNPSCCGSACKRVKGKNV
jgi:hypothetical protein